MDGEQRGNPAVPILRKDYKMPLFNDGFLNLTGGVGDGERNESIDIRDTNVSLLKLIDGL